MKILKTKWYVTRCRTISQKRDIIFECGPFSKFWVAADNMPPRVPGVWYIPARGDRILNNPQIYELEQPE
jgi:hypothetical protein